MPNQVDADDWLYRMVRPPHYSPDEVSPLAFIDKYEAQSFNLARLSSPRETLEKFAEFPGTRKLCSKRAEEADPTYLEMYNAGYRVIACSVRAILENGLTFRPEANGDEYNSRTSHVNVIGAKYKAATLAASAHVLTQEEMDTSYRPPLSS